MRLIMINHLTALLKILWLCLAFCFLIHKHRCTHIIYRIKYLPAVWALVQWVVHNFMHMLVRIKHYITIIFSHFLAPWPINKGTIPCKSKLKKDCEMYFTVRVHPLFFSGNPGRYKAHIHFSLYHLCSLFRVLLNVSFFCLFFLFLSFIEQFNFSMDSKSCLWVVLFYIIIK